MLNPCRGGDGAELSGELGEEESSAGEPGTREPLTEETGTGEPLTGEPSSGEQGAEGKHSQTERERAFCTYRVTRDTHTQLCTDTYIHTQSNTQHTLHVIIKMFKCDR